MIGKLLEVVTWAFSLRTPRTWAAKSSTVQRWREERYRLFEQLCELRPDDRIIDVGAGWGAALERFNTVNPIVAVDLKPDATNGSAHRTSRSCRPTERSCPSATARLTLASRTR